MLWKYLNDAFIKEWIKHSLSSVNTSVLFVFKKNNELRLYVNYWELNWKMIKNYHVLSLIDETLNWLMSFI